MQTLRARLTFSNIVAVIALFIALGGGVYAASKINGKQIKKKTIAGKALKPDTLTGKQINESKLGTVPDAAALAGNGPGAFVSSGDVKRIRYDLTTQSSDPDQQTVLALGPLQVTMSCAKGSFEVTASTSAADAGWDIGYALNNNISSTDGGFLGSAEQSLLANTFTNATQRYVGTFLYNDPSTTISVPFVVVASDQTPGSSRCFFTGTATRATG
jgi:hypothetical protein